VCVCVCLCVCEREIKSLFLFPSELKLREKGEMFLSFFRYWSQCKNLLNVLPETNCDMLLVNILMLFSKLSDFKKLSCMFIESRDYAFNLLNDS
jgi:hypothetical protein